MRQRCPKGGLAAGRLDNWRLPANIDSVDIYDEALKRFRADDRPLLELEKVIRIPWTTLRDIKNGTTKDPEFRTLKKLAKHYNGQPA